MSERDLNVEQRLRFMSEVLRRTGEKFRKGSLRAFGNEAVDWNDPFEEVARREEMALADAQVAAEGAAARFVGMGVQDLPAELREVIDAAVLEQFAQYENTLIEWFFAPGPHPLEVLRRLFAYAKQKRASLLWNMGFRDLGDLLNESHESLRLRCAVLFRGLPAGWHKDADACDRMAESARGNRNRRGGDKLLGKREQRDRQLAKDLEKTKPKPPRKKLHP